MFINIDLTDDVADAADAVFGAIILNAMNDFLHYPRSIKDAVPTDCRGASQHEFNRIVGAGDPAANDRSSKRDNTDEPCAVRQALSPAPIIPHHIPKTGSASVDINCHS